MSTRVFIDSLEFVFDMYINRPYFSRTSVTLESYDHFLDSPIEKIYAVPSRCRSTLIVIISVI